MNSFYSLESFGWRFFQWSLSDSKFPHVSRTLINILPDLNNAVVWMVSNRPISKSSSPSTNSSVTTERSIYNWYNGHFHVQLIFQFSNTVKVLTSLYAFLQFYSEVSWNGEVHYSAGSFFFFFFWLSQSLVVWPRLGDPFVSQNPRDSFLGQILIS